MDTPTTLYDLTMTGIDGQPKALADFRGRVLLVVNVASRCGFTPQYAGLEALYRRHRDAGFTVLGFPCDQFGHQEPGTDADIQEFCSTSFDVTFPMFGKIDVNGPGTAPLFAFLKAERPGLLGSKAIKWNFTKFLVDREGRVVRRFAPSDSPESIEPAIAKLLDAPAAP